MANMIWFSLPNDIVMDAAKRISKEIGLTPYYWLYNPSNQNSYNYLNEPFIRIKHDIYKAYKTIPPDGAPAPVVVDEVLLRRFDGYFDAFNRQLDRCAPSDAFTYAERADLFRRNIAHWYSVLTTDDVRFVLFSNTPHNCYDYIAYAVATELGIPTAMFVASLIGATCLHTTTVRVAPRVDVRVGAKPNELVRAHLDSVRTQALMPWYMDSATFDEPGTYVSPWSLKAMYMKLPGVPYEESNLGQREWAEYQQYAVAMRREFKRRYIALAEKVDPDVPYVYMPLHYQPERSTCPEGGAYTDQILAAQVVASKLPEGWQLYVKEHPSQFSDKGYGELGRSLTDYQKLKEIPGVKLVSLDTSTFALTDSAKAVVTITGTPGWEAVLRGKPAITFGEPWYSTCSGVYRCHSAEEVGAAFTDIVAGAAPDPSLVDAFAQSVFEQGFRGYLEPGNDEVARLGPMTAEERAKNIADAVARIWREVKPKSGR